MNNVRKGKAKYILAPLVMLLLMATAQVGNGRAHAYTGPDKCGNIDTFPKKLAAISPVDTAKPFKNDTTVVPQLVDSAFDSTKFQIKKDTIAFKTTKGALDAP